MGGGVGWMNVWLVFIYVWGKEAFVDGLGFFFFGKNEVTSWSDGNGARAVYASRNVQIIKPVHLNLDLLF